MIEPTGYTALDLIGFTDRGAYDPTANYVKNDIVTVGNTKWRCKVDDTTGVTPAENANWTIYLESATSLAGMDDVILTSPKNGDGLVHDGNDWKNIPIMTKEQWKKNGAYNLAPNDLISQVEAGITYQTLSNKTIQASGTASGSSSIWITKNIKLKKGTYKICGTPSGGHYNNGYALYVTIGNTAIATDTENTLGLSDIFTVTNEATLYNLAVVIRSGVTAPSAPFKPMITTDLNATYDDFVPHAKTNGELTDDVTPTRVRHETLDNTNFFGTVDVYKVGKIVYVMGDINIKTNIAYNTVIIDNIPQAIFTACGVGVGGDGSIRGRIGVSGTNLIASSNLTSGYTHIAMSYLAK